MDQIIIHYHYKSIQDQALGNIKIIYIDDYSNDNSVEIIENYQKKIKK